MNIETLQEHIIAFKREVLDSGFKRDLDDFVSSLPASQNNILALRDIAAKTLSALDKIYSRDLPVSLRALFPAKNIRPFTEMPHNENLRTLIGNSEMQLTAFFNALTQFLSQLQQQVNQNVSEIKRIEQFIAPYISQDLANLSTDGSAIISVCFKEKDTISSLKRFSNSLAQWSRTLPIYHQLIKGSSPRDIEIIAVQNGSIDLAVNVNIDVAVKLAEVFEVGFKVFASYLLYKKMARPQVDAYFGNKKLIEIENEKEKHMLENVRAAVVRQIEKQHDEAKSRDKKVDGTAIPKKVEQVADLVVSHIVKGNDLKLLAIPAPSADDPKDGAGAAATPVKQKDALLESSIQARREFRDMGIDDKQKLLEMYGDPESEK